MLYSISYICILIITIFYQNKNMDFARIIPQSSYYIGRLHSACNRQEINTCQHIIIIYIDLSKALHTLNFDILLYKLRYYGITDIALKLLQSYMSNRKQYVKYNVNESGVK